MFQCSLITENEVIRTLASCLQSVVKPLVRCNEAPVWCDASKGEVGALNSVVMPLVLPLTGNEAPVSAV